MLLCWLGREEGCRQAGFAARRAGAPAVSPAQHATVDQHATGPGRLPLPPQWQQHAELIDRLLDAAARDPPTVGLTVSNEPIDSHLVGLFRDWIQHQVMDEVDRADNARENALIHAFFGDDAALDLLAAHVTTQTAQSARLALQPAPDTLCAVQRGHHEVFVCRGAELHHRPGRAAHSEGGAPSARGVSAAGQGPATAAP
ncbi:hypothetical protein ACWD5R_45390 [Streptomyces sp. NPDC002514]|uniref:hypothetical protein n=1 Tax=Streptomyces sp. NPDC001270 TaxID=3364554 RepID=UPI00368F4377